MSSGKECFSMLQRKGGQVLHRVCMGLRRARYVRVRAALIVLIVVFSIYGIVVHKDSEMNCFVY